MVPFVSILIILAALLTMVGVMYMVMTEKHEDEAKIKYVNSPFPTPPAPPQAEKPAETVVAPEESADAKPSDKQDA